MKQTCILSPARQLTEVEQSLVWQKPLSHIESEAEKLDLPPKSVMMERAKAKTGYPSESVLSLLAETIILLDETARSNAINGVAGMRSYIFWTDAVARGESIQNTLYQKVLFKITTDLQELAILEQALASHGLTEHLAELDSVCHSHSSGENPEIMELHISEDGEYFSEIDESNNNAIGLRKSADSEGHSSESDEGNENHTGESSNDNGENGSLFYHELDKPVTSEQKNEFRRQLNKEARQSVEGSCQSFGN